MNVFFSGNPAHVATTFLSIHGNSLNKMIKIIKKKVMKIPAIENQYACQ